MASNLRRRALAAAVAVAVMVQAGQASALGLVEAYEAALQNDPIYQSAVHENEAGQQYKVLGRSNLLPSVTASYSKFKNRADITAPNFLGQTTTTHPEYDSSSGVVQLRQPLFNLDGLARYRQGLAQTAYSDAQFSAKKKDLLIRLVAAYAEAKYAEDQLALAAVQRDTFAEQRKVNERMFQRGEGTKTDMLETQARFDLAEAQVIEARDAVVTARNTLAAIVGKDVNELDGLSDDFRVKPMQPTSYDEWKALALENNAELAALRYSVEAAQQEISKARAGHAPRLDFIASYNKSDSDTLNTRNQDSTARTVGVQLNIPIYSGGSVSASTSQAVANHEKAKSDLEAKTKQVLVELRKQYSLVLSSASRIDAMVKSVQSARELVQATQQSVKGGVRINLDVLNAQQQLYTAQRDLAQARYSYLLSYLRLRQAAGTLNSEDLHTVAGYFVKGGGSNATSASLLSLPAVAVKGTVEPLRTMPQPASVATPAKAPLPENGVVQQKDVLDTVQAWALAWSKRDVQSYLGFYAADFQPANGVPRDAWAAERKSRIEGNNDISVLVEAPELTVNGTTATVKFRQIYKSDRLSRSGDKTLVLAKVAGKWKIKQEVSGT